MDQRLQAVLESLLLNVEVLNSEVMRLGRCDQFTPAAGSFQLIERIPSSCMCSLQNIRTIERRLEVCRTEAKAGPADILPLNDNASPAP